MTTSTIRSVLDWVGKLFRMWPAWVSSVILLVIIWHIAPQQIGNTAYKMLVLTLGGVIGFWMHVWAFGHIDNDLLMAKQDSERNRRALLIVGSMIAFSLAT